MVYESTERVIAPWTLEQKDSLIAYQKQIFPQQAYYCDFSNKHSPLLVTDFNMICSQCDKKQFWAFLVACDWTWKQKLSHNDIAGNRTIHRFGSERLW